jgi:hypothetical protein
MVKRIKEKLWALSFVDFCELRRFSRNDLRFLKISGKFNQQQNQHDNNHSSGLLMHVFSGIILMLIILLAVAFILPVEK